MALSQFDFCYIAHTSTAVDITRDNQPKRRHRRRRLATQIGNNDLLSFVMWIDLTESERHRVAVSPGDHKRVLQARIFAGLVDRLGPFEQRPQEDARIAA